MCKLPGTGGLPSSQAVRSHETPFNSFCGSLLLRESYSVLPQTGVGSKHGWDEPLFLRPDLRGRQQILDLWETGGFAFEPLNLLGEDDQEHCKTSVPCGRRKMRLKESSESSHGHWLWGHGRTAQELCKRMAELQQLMFIEELQGCSLLCTHNSQE